ncbi:ThiF family adenylyltransferase [Ruminococcus sp. 5_1_39BFAA]|uniref:ThiF family adenylyltransferase n=1 Tax=Ruminococcus sp. 5_1_39BFAA TaxID=457412 RepID=UPI0035695E1D
MADIFNALKLPVYLKRFRGKKVMIIGGGAVGSYLAEFLAKEGFGTIAVVDFDKFEYENAAKHSGIVRTPEDVGKNKAVCVAERIRPLMIEGGISVGIDGDIAFMGPEAYAEFDIVCLCVDNYAAKLVVDENIRQLPDNIRPAVIMCGTYEETAQSVMIDGKECCLRCLFDEKWLIDPSVRTSCSGPQLREIDGKQEIIRTSGLASQEAAHLAAEQCRSFVLGVGDSMNRRITYTAYPNLELSVSRPMKKRNCPGCGTLPAADVIRIKGSVLDLTLRDAMSQITDILQTDDFEISTHRLNYKNVVHSGYIVDDVCHCCGRPIKVMKHECRTFLEDLVCEACKEKMQTPRYDTAFAAGHILRAFTPDCPDEIKDRTLFDLGYPLGAHIDVIQRNGALDFLDDDKITVSTVICDGDSEMVLKIHSLHHSGAEKKEDQL